MPLVSSFDSVRIFGPKTHHLGQRSNFNGSLHKLHVVLGDPNHFLVGRNPNLKQSEEDIYGCG